MKRGRSSLTKKELEQLIYLKKEIEELEQKIAQIEQMDISSAPVRVNASGQNFPYVQGWATVQGYNPVLADKRSKLLCENKMMLKERKESAAREEQKLLQYINNVKESRIRRIMQYKYVDGYSWDKIGNIMHFDRRTGERIVSRYLNQNKNTKKIQ